MDYEKIISENREMKFILSTKEEQVKFLDDKVKILELNNENLQKKADLFFEFKLEETKSIVKLNQQKNAQVYKKLLECIFFDIFIFLFTCSSLY